MGYFENVAKEDGIRLQIATSALLITLGYWYISATFPNELIQNLSGIFLVLPIMLGIYILLMWLAYLPHNKIKNLRIGLREQANYWYTMAMVTFFWGAFLYITLYFCAYWLLKWLLERKLFGYSVFAIPWISVPIAILIWLYRPKEGYVNALKKRFQKNEKVLRRSKK